jgi:hypothetical protein
MRTCHPRRRRRCRRRPERPTGQLRPTAPVSPRSSQRRRPMPGARVSPAGLTARPAVRPAPRSQHSRRLRRMCQQARRSVAPPAGAQEERADDVGDPVRGSSRGVRRRVAFVEARHGRKDSRRVMRGCVVCLLCVGLLRAPYSAAVRPKAPIVVGLPRGVRGSCSDLFDGVGRPGSAAAPHRPDHQRQTRDQR